MDEENSETPYSRAPITEQLDITDEQETNVNTESTLKKKSRFLSIVGIDRITGLSSNVYAFSMTLLVNNITMPELGNTQEQIFHHFAEKWNDILGIFYIHMIMLVYWTIHVQVFAVMRITDTSVAHANILVLMFVSCIPFTVGFTTRWFDQFYATLIVNGNLALIGMCMCIIWFYAIYKRQLLEETLSSDSINLMTLRILFPPLIYILSIPLGAVSTWASFAINMSVAINFVLVGFSIDTIGWLYEIVKYIGYKAYATKKKRKNTPYYESDYAPNPDYLEENDLVVKGEEYTLPEEDENEFTSSDEYHDRVAGRIGDFGDNIFGTTITMLAAGLIAPDSYTPKSYLMHVANSTVLANQTIVWNNYTRIANETLDKWQLNDILGTQIDKAMGIKFMSHVVCVLMIGTYWKQHTYVNRGLRRTSMLFVMFSLTFLTATTFIPFAAYLVSRYIEFTLSIAAFTLLLFVISILLLCAHVTANHISHLKTDEYSTPRVKLLALYRVIGEPLTYLLAFGISFANRYAGLAIAILVPLNEILAAFRLDFYRRSWKYFFILVDKYKKRK